jgi:hypothetical protein
MSPNAQPIISIPDIQIKVTYGYHPNIRTIIQTVSASKLKLGKNSIKIEDPKIHREIKVNPEMKLIPSLTFYPSLDPKHTNIVNNATSGQVYYPPEKTYYNNIPNIPEEKLLNMLTGVDISDPINDNIIITQAGDIDNTITETTVHGAPSASNLQNQCIGRGNCMTGWGYLVGSGCVPWSDC